MPDVPKGFAVQVFARGLKQAPRHPDRAERRCLRGGKRQRTRPGLPRRRRPKGGPATPEVFAENLDRPYGIVFHPPSDPRYVYVAAANQVVRFPYRTETARRPGRPKSSSRTSPPSGIGRATWRSPGTGKRLFVSIGSASNVAAGDAGEDAGGNPGL